MSSNQFSLKAAYHTLGCKLNFSETSTIGRLLSERGIETAAHGERPDIIVVNTCSVTETADKKGRQLIRRLAKEWPDATLVVTGCYAQLKPEEVAALKGVDIVLGANEKLRIATFLDEWTASRRQRVQTTPPLQITDFHPSCERGDRTRYFLKVQDGCDYFCTYCTIPFARGRSRSGSIAHLTDIARQVADEGGKEIVITGVNIGDFGRTTGESLLDLFKSLDSVAGIERYRISSIEPNLLSEDIIRWLAADSRAFMPHFHIPLQAGSDEVLRMMARRYDTALFASRISLIRELTPHAFIGVDVIAGARGETPQLWELGRDFIKSLPVTRLHVFPYSERPGTRALGIDYIVDPAERHRRTQELIEISDRKLDAFVKEQIGRTADVLWEHPTHGGDLMHGFTDNYIRIQAPFRPELVNTLTRVTVSPENLAPNSDPR